MENIYCKPARCDCPPKPKGEADKTVKTERAKSFRLFLEEPQSSTPRGKNKATVIHELHKSSLQGAIDDIHKRRKDRKSLKVCQVLKSTQQTTLYHPYSEAW